MGRTYLHFADGADLKQIVSRPVTNVTCNNSQGPLKHVNVENNSPLLWYIGSATGKRGQSTGHSIAESISLGPLRS